jgi:uncharacterized protein
MKAERIGKIKEIVSAELADCSAHNIDHVLRVYDLAVRIAEAEKVNMEVVEAAALLHDIGRTDHAVEGAKIAEPILRELGFAEDEIKHICDCIVTHRYRTDNKPQTKEAEIVFDADKLETVGAVGISRMMAWVGKNRASIYRDVDVDEYAKENLGGLIKGRIRDKSKHSPQIQWKTKDKFILDFLHTDKAKEIARERLAFSEMFLERLEKEIKGDL